MTEPAAPATPARARRGWLVWVPLVGLLVLCIAALVVLGKGERANARAPRGLIGQAAPAFDLPGLALQSGQEAARVRLSDFAGRPVLVNIFASWCVPCRVEHPVLVELAKAYPGQVIAIAYKDKPAATRLFLAELGNPFAAIGQDRDGLAALAFGVTGVPESFVISADGRIQAIWRGPLQQDQARDLIAPMLAAK